MLARMAVVSIAAIAVAVVGAARAQTSIVTIEASQSGDSALAPAPVKPLEISDGEYPFESLLAEEQGKVVLGFIIDSAGHPVNLQILSSSGTAALDLQAARILVTRGVFLPSSSNSAAKFIVDWRLPLEPVHDYDISTSASSANATLAKATGSHSVEANDYPPLSIKAKEQGIVGLRYAIRTDGSVGEVQIVQSSGVKRLDDAAARMLQLRWKFEPATVDGKPVEVWIPATVGFQILPDVLDKRYLRCYARPIGGGEVVAITGALFKPGGNPPLFPKQIVDRWTLVNRSGDVADVLLSTKSGLQRPIGSLANALKGTGYRVPDAANGCWYYDPLVIPQ